MSDDRSTDRVTDTQLRILVGIYEATSASARSIHQNEVLACLRELERARAYIETANVEARAAEAVIERLRADVHRLRAGLKSAREWLDGWASAVPYINVIDGILGAQATPDVGYDANGSPVGGCIHCGDDH